MSGIKIKDWCTCWRSTPIDSLLPDYQLNTSACIRGYSRYNRKCTFPLRLRRHRRRLRVRLRILAWGIFVGCCRSWGGGLQGGFLLLISYHNYWLFSKNTAILIEIIIKISKILYGMDEWGIYSRLRLASAVGKGFLGLRLGFRGWGDSKSLGIWI